MNININSSPRLRAWDERADCSDCVFLGISWVDESIGDDGRHGREVAHTLRADHPNFSFEQEVPWDVPASKRDGLVPHDLYYCGAPDRDHWTVIARFGEYGDYLSGAIFANPTKLVYVREQVLCRDGKYRNRPKMLPEHEQGEEIGESDFYTKRVPRKPQIPVLGEAGRLAVDMGLLTQKQLEESDGNQIAG